MGYFVHPIKTGVLSLWKKASRWLLRLVMLLAPEGKKIAAERRLRGREQVRKLRKAGIVVVSFGKSGRTWLRVLLSRVYQQAYQLPSRSLFGFDNFHYMNKTIPRIFFTHDNYVKDFTGHHDTKEDYYGKKVVFLARDPRDVAVSQFFQWRYRMKPGKKSLNSYPEHGADISIYEFVMGQGAGLEKIIGFMNLWAREANKMSSFFLLRYEDLRARPEKTLLSLLEFISVHVTADQIKEAIEFASVENMRKMEQDNTFWLSGGRMVPRDRENPDSFKVRRAKVGGYRDYFDDAELETIEALVEDKLDPYFGYARSWRAGEDASSGAGPN